MISNKCKYAIKALIYIAKNGENKNILASEISRDENIPKKFLENILRDLKNSQFLKSKRGAYGGYKLNKSAAEITLIEIVRVINGPIALTPCVSIMYHETCTTCADENTCAIKSVFLEIRDATLKIYSKTTIASLVNK